MPRQPYSRNDPDHIDNDHLPYIYSFCLIDSMICSFLSARKEVFAIEAFLSSGIAQRAAQSIQDGSL
jgi:hypothetical protein